MKREFQIKILYKINKVYKYNFLRGNVIKLKFMKKFKKDKKILIK